MKSKSFRFITLPLLALMLLSIVFSAYKESDEEKWKQNMEKLLDYIPFFGSSSQPETKVVHYTPSAQPQDVHVGDGKWNFKIATTKGYYEVPKYGRTRDRHTPVPIIGEPCQNATVISLIPCKNVNYYGGALVNSLPNGSVVRSDNRGYVKISLNLPKKIKKVKGEKIKLIFTSVS